MACRQFLHPPPEAYAFRASVSAPRRSAPGVLDPSALQEPQPLPRTTHDATMEVHRRDIDDKAVERERVVDSVAGAAGEGGLSGSRFGQLPEAVLQDAALRASLTDGEQAALRKKLAQILTFRDNVINFKKVCQRSLNQVVEALAELQSLHDFFHYDLKLPTVGGLLPSACATSSTKIKETIFSGATHLITSTRYERIAAARNGLHGLRDVVMHMRNLTKALCMMERGLVEERPSRPSGSTGLSTSTCPGTSAHFHRHSEKFPLGKYLPPAAVGGEDGEAGMVVVEDSHRAGVDAVVDRDVDSLATPTVVDSSDALIADLVACAPSLASFLAAAPDGHQHQQHPREHREWLRYHLVISGIYKYWRVKRRLQSFASSLKAKALSQIEEDLATVAAEHAHLCSSLEGATNPDPDEKCFVLAGGGARGGGSPRTSGGARAPGPGADDASDAGGSGAGAGAGATSKDENYDYLTVTPLRIAKDDDPPKKTIRDLQKTKRESFRLRGVRDALLKFVPALELLIRSEARLCSAGDGGGSAGAGIFVAKSSESDALATYLSQQLKAVGELVDRYKAELLEEMEQESAREKSLDEGTGSSAVGTVSETESAIAMLDDRDDEDDTATTTSASSSASRLQYIRATRQGYPCDDCAGRFPFFLFFDHQYQGSGGRICLRCAERRRAVGNQCPRLSLLVSRGPQPEGVKKKRHSHLFCEHQQKCLKCDATFQRCVQCCLAKGDAADLRELLQELKHGATPGQAAGDVIRTFACGSQAAEHVSPPYPTNSRPTRVHMFFDFDLTLCSTKSGANPLNGCHALDEDLLAIMQDALAPQQQDREQLQKLKHKESLGLVQPAVRRPDQRDESPSVWVLTKNPHQAQIREFLRRHSPELGEKVGVLSVPGRACKRDYIDAVLQGGAATEDDVCVFVDDDINEHARFSDKIDDPNGNGGGRIFRVLFRRH